MASVLTARTAPAYPQAGADGCSTPRYLKMLISARDSDKTGLMVCLRLLDMFTN